MAKSISVHKIHIDFLVFDEVEFIFLPLLLIFTSKRKIITVRPLLPFVLRRAMYEEVRFNGRTNSGNETRFSCFISHWRSHRLEKYRVKGAMTCLFQKQGFQPGHLCPQLTNDPRHRILVDHRPIDHALRPLRESQRAGRLVVTSARWRDSWKQRTKKTWTKIILTIDARLHCCYPLPHHLLIINRGYLEIATHRSNFKFHRE